MSGAGWLLWLPFRVSVNPSEADELTVGPVWGPGVVEELTVGATAVNVYVRAWAVASRLPLMQGQALDEVLPQGTLLTGAATDTQLESRRTGIELAAAFQQVVAIGIMVPWAVWYVRVRVESVAVAVSLVSGQLRVRVFEREDLWQEMAAGQRKFDFGREGRWRESVAVGVGSAEIGQVVVARR